MKKLGAASLGVILTVALAFGALANVASAAKPPAIAGVTVPVAGTAPGNVPVVGDFAIDRFKSGGGNAVQAVGTFTGTVGTVAGSQRIALPVSLAQSTGSCEILDLVLGPLDLNLLGLVVHLDQVHLNITAEQGPGNLLGNLLCAVAGLLDGSASGGQLANLLNQILSILNGLGV